MILNPCRKCIVRPCCSEVCEPYLKWTSRITMLLGPFIFVIDLYKSKEWVLLGMFIFMYVAVIIQITYACYMVSRGVSKL